MRVVVTPRGELRFLYEETVGLELQRLGRVTVIERVSFVEPYGALWYANVRNVPEGPELGPFHTRGEAVVAEIEWLERNVLQ